MKECFTNVKVTPVESKNYKLPNLEHKKGQERLHKAALENKVKSFVWMNKTQKHMTEEWLWDLNSLFKNYILQSGLKKEDAPENLSVFYLTRNTIQNVKGKKDG